MDRVGRAVVDAPSDLGHQASQLEVIGHSKTGNTAETTPDLSIGTRFLPKIFPPIGAISAAIYRDPLIPQPGTAESGEHGGGKYGIVIAAAGRLPRLSMTSRYQLAIRPAACNKASRGDRAADQSAGAADGFE